jgi:hypothetical protein
VDAFFVFVFRLLVFFESESKATFSHQRRVVAYLFLLYFFFFLFVYVFRSTTFLLPFHQKDPDPLAYFSHCPIPSMVFHEQQPTHTLYITPFSQPPHVINPNFSKTLVM